MFYIWTQRYHIIFLNNESFLQDTWNDYDLLSRWNMNYYKLVGYSLTKAKNMQKAWNFEFPFIHKCNRHSLTLFLCLHTVYSIWPIDRTLSGATPSVQSGPGSNGSEGVHHIPLISKARALPWDCLESYPGHSLGWGFLPLCRDAIGVFYNHWRLGHE